MATMTNTTFTQRENQEKKVQKVKVPPHSIEAEQSLLGGLLIDSNAWDKIVDRVSENDFYRNDHRLIFRAMTELAKRNNPFDVLTITESLKSLQQLENAGSEVYLFEIANNTPSAANIIAYADIVHERSVLRHLLAAANNIADSVYQQEGRSSDELLQLAEQKVFDIAEYGSNKNDPVNINSLLTKAMTRIDELYHRGEPITGVPTGFADLDELTSGLQKGDLIIIAGRPSMGKTILGLNIAENVAIKTKLPVLVFSLEMSGEQLATRMMSSLGRIDQHKLRTGKLTDDDWPRITSSVSMLSEAPLFIDDTASMGPMELRSRARRIARGQGQLGLIVVDYLQLMTVPGRRENRTLEISEISRSLKILAKELNVPVLAISQLNRALEQRHDKRPVMSDLRESGAIEQDADVIAFIYRDEVYNDESPNKGIAEIIIGKQRNGPIGKIKLTFLGQFTRFENYSGL